MANVSHNPDPGRRRFLANTLKVFFAFAGTALLYPLLRFTGFHVKPKPRYIVVRKNIPAGGSYTEHDFILFLTDQGPLAISRRCTHLGCRVNYRAELGLIECPCHQSRFSVSGVRISGPAQKNLAIYPVRELKDDTGKVNGYEVTI